MDNAIAKSLYLICNYFNLNNINYVIVGGISVLAWGLTRTTEDIDIIVDHVSLDINDFVNYLNNNNFYADASDFDGFTTKDHCTIFYKDGLFRIDIIGIYNKDNEISIYDAKRVEFHGIELRIDSPESLIAHKLLFGSQQDLEDAIAVMLKNKEKIDLITLNNHSKRLNVESKLKKFLKRIEDLENEDF